AVLSGGGLLLGGGSSPPRVALSKGSCWASRGGGDSVSEPAGWAARAPGFDPLLAAAAGALSGGLSACSNGADCLPQPVRLHLPPSAPTARRPPPSPQPFAHLAMCLLLPDSERTFLAASSEGPQS